MHPFALLSEIIQVGRALVLPAIVGGMSMGGGHMGRMVLWGVALLGVPTLVFAVLEHLAFQYRVGADELTVDSGVFSRRHRILPLSRIQNIELRQNALQRALGVAELRVESAGDTEEAVPLVLARPEAERLRAELLARRAAARGAETSLQEGETPARAQLAHLSARDLVLAGATANEAGILAAVLIGALEVASQLPLGIPWSRLDPRPLFPHLSVLSTAVLGLATMLVLFSIAWIFSILGALIRYWEFRLDESGGELRKTYGGLDRHEITIPLRRVQAVRVEESVLRRPLGLASLKIETASGQPGEAKRSGAEAFVPLTRVRDIPRIVCAVFPDLRYDGLSFRAVHPYARRRALLQYCVSVLVLTAGALLWLGTLAGWLLVLLIPAYLAAQAHYHHLGYALTPGYVIGRAGFWNRVTWIVPQHRIQTVHLVETPLQRRAAVATLIVDTAAGQARVVDLGRAGAVSLFSQVANAPHQLAFPSRKPEIASLPRERSSGGNGQASR